MKQKGCNGLSYTLDYTNEKGKFDEEVNQDGKIFPFGNLIPRVSPLPSPGAREKTGRGETLGRRLSFWVFGCYNP